QRPFITLKWAESADGYLDARISTPFPRMLVHKLRATSDALLVGSGTAIADNPSLTVRDFAGKSPLRVLLDRRKRVCPENPIFPAIVYSDYSSLSEVLTSLYYDHKVTSLLVEGGGKVLRSFIGTGLWDVTRIERGRKPTGGEVPAPPAPEGIVTSTEIIDGNVITTIRNSKTLL
ncbi:MAG: RibD family protein, partial [Duncaniella sp.]|nr:RibD family protein [Duncaniella sp.]